MQLKYALLLLTLFNYENLCAMKCQMEGHMCNEPEHQVDTRSSDHTEGSDMEGLDTEGVDGLILDKPDKSAIKYDINRYESDSESIHSDSPPNTVEPFSPIDPYLPNGD